MKTMACVYFTHNHPETVEDVLSNISDSYFEKGIDIIYYDSSDNDETKKIIENYISKGYSNIHRIDMPFCRTHGDEKYVYFLKKYGFDKDYDYIWNSKDRVWFRGETLDNIVDTLQNEDNDIVFTVSENDRWELIIPKLKDVYNDPVEFFAHYGHLTTNWECLIRKTETMIDGIDMDAIIKKYNISKNNNFNQTVSLFSCFNEIKENSNISIRIIRTDNKDRVYSDTQNGSGWSDIVFELWLDRWIKVVWLLPDIYDKYKLSIVRAELGNPFLFGSVDALVAYRNNGTLTRNVYNKYQKIMNMVIDIPENIIEMVIEEKYDEIKSNQLSLFYRSFQEENYDLSYRLFVINEWMRFHCSEEMYIKLGFCFKIYKEERNKYGDSILFKNMHSPEELIQRFELFNDHIEKSI